MRLRWKYVCSFLVAPMLGALSAANAQPAPPSVKQVHLKHVLVIGETKGFEHDSISAAMDAVYTMGKESGLWDTEMRTDTELLTKKDLGRNAKNLGVFRRDCLCQYNRRAGHGRGPEAGHALRHQGGR